MVSPKEQALVPYNSALAAPQEKVGSRGEVDFDSDSDIIGNTSACISTGGIVRLMIAFGVLVVGGVGVGCAWHHHQANAVSVSQSQNQQNLQSPKKGNENLEKGGNRESEKIVEEDTQKEDFEQKTDALVKEKETENAGVQNQPEDTVIQPKPEDAVIQQVQSVEPKSQSLQSEGPEQSSEKSEKYQTQASEKSERDQEFEKIKLQLALFDQKQAKAWKALSDNWDATNVNVHEAGNSEQAAVKAVENILAVEKHRSKEEENFRKEWSQKKIKRFDAELAAFAYHWQEDLPDILY